MDLRDNPALAGLNDTQIENLAAAATAIELKAGATVVREGEPNDDLFLFGAGRFRVEAGGQKLAVLEAPCVIGEMELLTGGAPAATVTAMDACTGHRLAYADLRHRIADGDLASLRLVYNVAVVVARRLTVLDERVAQMHDQLDGAAAVASKKDLQQLRAKLFGEWA